MSIASGLRAGMPLRSLVLAAAAYLALATAGASAAGVVVGSVLAVRGAVFAEADGERRPLVADMPVHRADTIVAAAGKAKIALGDGTVISVGANSRVRIADYSEAVAGPAGRLELVSGVMRLIVRSSAAGRFEVETETAIAAVRGTDWAIEVTPERTSVVVVTGVVAVSGRNGAAGAMVVLDMPQAGTDVRRGSAPTPPVRWGDQRYASTLARATFD